MELLVKLKLTFASRLSEIRKSKGFTQPDFAAAVGIPVDTLRNWEQGRREPSFDDIDALADTLGIEPRDLFTAPGKRAAPSAEEVLAILEAALDSPGTRAAIANALSALLNDKKR